VDRTIKSGTSVGTGIIREDDETSLLPPVARVLSETCKKLEAAGHEIVELDFHRSAEIPANAVNFFKIDGGKVCITPFLK
jgi:amidase